MSQLFHQLDYSSDKKTHKLDDRDLSECDEWLSDDENSNYISLAASNRAAELRVL